MKYLQELRHSYLEKAVTNIVFYTVDTMHSVQYYYDLLSIIPELLVYKYQLQHHACIFTCDPWYPNLPPTQNRLISRMLVVFYISQNAPLQQKLYVIFEIKLRTILFAFTYNFLCWTTGCSPFSPLSHSSHVGTSGSTFFYIVAVTWYSFCADLPTAMQSRRVFHICILNPSTYHAHDVVMHYLDVCFGGNTYFA